MPCVSSSFNPAIGPVIPVGLALPDHLRANAKPIVHTCNALVDTGAARTCVSSKTAMEIGLQAMGKTQMSSASHTVAVNVYPTNLHFFFGPPDKGMEYRIGNIALMEFRNAPDAYPVLLGRDILALGLFQMSGADNRFILCF